MSAGADVIVVGAGLAGLAATAALAESGARVTTLEWRPYLGGRAYSYVHPALDEVIDSQHVVLGCCTNIVDLVTRAGASDAIRWYDEMVFLEPGGRRSVLKPSGLPAPMQQTMSLLRAPMLSLRDKVSLARGLMEFLRGFPENDTESVASWMRRTHQTERAIRHFWEPVILATLNDSFERCSLKYAGKVFHEAFLRSARAGQMGVPTKPLSEFFAPVATRAEAMGATIRLRSQVRGVARVDEMWQVRLGTGEVLCAPSLVLATDFRRTGQLLREVLGAGFPELIEERLQVAPITSVHLWFDREVTTDEHAALLDTRIQWMFHKSRIRRWPAERGSYLELVISGSFPELGMTREVVLASAMEELAMFYPAVRGATLVKSAVLKEARATFSVTPGLDTVRVDQRMGLPGLFVAGDWTRTEWPSTMEGAVRSGRLAAGRALGRGDGLLAAELPASGLMQWLSR